MIEKVDHIEMITSYTLVRVLPAKDKEVYGKIKEYSEVKEVILTYGEYDLIIRVESESLEDLDHFIFNKLRTTDGVAATTTLLEAKPTSFVEGG
jgi:DNA-binding Lrp family transcriptional regulator